MDPFDLTSPTALLTHPLYSHLPGNMWHSPSSPTSAAPPPPPPPMRRADLDTAIVELADRFRDAGSISQSNLREHLGKVSPASQALLERALERRAVGVALRAAVPNDGAFGFNAQRLQAGDLAKLKAQVQGGGGPELEAVRNAVGLAD